MNSKSRKFARKAFKYVLALWLIVFLGSFFTANRIVDYVHFGLIAVWGALLWYGYDDSVITPEDFNPVKVIEGKATEVKEGK